jgi:hypothetical protein
MLVVALASMNEAGTPVITGDGEVCGPRGKLRPPISMLPVEILTRILREHLTTSVLKPMPERLAPLNADPHWKAVALNDPRSWTTLSPDRPEYPGVVRSASSTRFKYIKSRGKAAG